MFASYFLIPVIIPGLGVTLHGVLLLSAFAGFLLGDPRRASVRRYWPFLSLFAVLSASWFWAEGGADLPTVRALTFGLLAAFLTAFYLRGDAAVPALTPLMWALPACATVIASLYAAAALGAAVPVVDPFIRMGLSSYHSGLFFVVAVPLVWFKAVRMQRPTLLLALLPVWMALIISGVRGFWVGALASVLIFGWAARRSFQTVAVCVIAITAFALTLSLSERHLRERARFVATMPATPAASGEAPAALTAANLVSKTGRATGAEKFREEFSRSGRVGYWMAGIRIWLTSPALGVGPGNFAARSEAFALPAHVRRDAESRFDAHNMFVAVLAELGIAGFAALLALILVPTRRWVLCRQAEPSRRDVLALAASVFTGLTVVGLTWDVHIQRLWWIGLGLLWGAVTPGGLGRRGEA